MSNIIRLEIEPGDGVRYMYCLLSEHVKFTAADQTTHMTALMSMSGLFAPGKAIFKKPQLEIIKFICILENMKMVKLVRFLLIPVKRENWLKH